MADGKAQRRKKGLIGGSLLIAYGLIGAVYSYYRDRTSMDYFAMGYAVRGAITHAVLFGFAGLCVIGWYCRDQQDIRDDRDYRDDRRD